MKRNSNRIHNNRHGFNGLFSTTGAEEYIITYSNKYIIEFIIFDYMFIKYCFKNSMEQSPWPSPCLTYSNNNLIICVYDIFSYELCISYELLVMNYV